MAIPIPNPSPICTVEQSLMALCSGCFNTPVMKSAFATVSRPVGGLVLVHDEQGQRWWAAVDAERRQLELRQGEVRLEFPLVPACCQVLLRMIPSQEERRALVAELRRAEAALIESLVEPVAS
jgi:hypothetical protein